MNNKKLRLKKDIEGNITHTIVDLMCDMSRNVFKLYPIICTKPEYQLLTNDALANINIFISEMNRNCE